MNNYYNFLEKISPKNYFLKLCFFGFVCFFISILINSTITYFFEFNIENNSDTLLIIKKNKIIHFGLTVLIGPLTESFLFQWLPLFFYSEYKLTKKNDVLFAVVLSLIFGVLHYYNIGYQISTTIIGFFYISLTMYYESKKMNYFFPVFFIHFMNNLFVFLFAVYKK
jgi:hypothetical protein